MGLPPGWVTDLDLPRRAQLHLLGNGVVPQQANLALTILLAADTYPTGQARDRPTPPAGRRYRRPRSHPAGDRTAGLNPPPATALTAPPS